MGAAVAERGYIILVMVGRPGGGQRSVDYLLSVLSPHDVAVSMRRFFETVPPDEVASMAERSRVRLDDDERSFLEMSPDFVTFLEQNRRALRTLDSDALREIFLPVIAHEPGEALVTELRLALPPPSHKSSLQQLQAPLRGSVSILAIIACGIVSVLIGLLGTRLMMNHAPAVPVRSSQPRHAAPHHAATRAPRRVLAKTRHRSRRIQRLAWHRTVRAPVASLQILPAEPRLVQRARLIVTSYLDSLMRGDASAALGNLGLSASAGISNLTEAPILGGATEFHVTRALLKNAGNAHVEVFIDSPQGRYIGNYIVSASGAAAWITAHEVIPARNRNI